MEEQTSDTCVFCSTKIVGPDHNERVNICYLKDQEAHFGCTLANYKRLETEGWRECTCEWVHKVTLITPRFYPSVRHRLWLQLKNFKRSEYQVLGDVERLPARTRELQRLPHDELLEDECRSHFRQETQLGKLSERLMVFAFSLCLLGIIAMFVAGGFDWRMEISFWTLLGLMIVCALTLAPESVVYFWGLENPKREDAYRMNKMMLIAHIGVFGAFLLSYVVMMKLSDNIYSHTWNGTITTSFLLVTLYIAVARYRLVVFALERTRPLSYASERKDFAPKRKLAQSRSSSDSIDYTAVRFAVDEEI